MNATEQVKYIGKDVSIGFCHSSQKIVGSIQRVEIFSGAWSGTSSIPRHLYSPDVVYDDKNLL